MIQLKQFEIKERKGLFLTSVTVGLIGNQKNRLESLDMCIKLETVNLWYISGCSCIHLASQFGHTSIVAYLIAKGQDVDMLDKNGMTPLMWAAYRVFG